MARPLSEGGLAEPLQLIQSIHESLTHTAIDSPGCGRYLAAFMSIGSEALILGLVLSADAFSASVAMGFRPFNSRNVVQFASVSAVIAIVALWMGALAGTHILSYIAAYDHWVAFLLLATVASHMAFEGIMGLIHPAHPVCRNARFHSLAKILMVSCATSLDALGVGMSLGISSKPILPFLSWVAIWTVTATVLGLYLARKLSLRFGPVISLIGAAILGFMSLQLLKI